MSHSQWHRRLADELAALEAADLLRRRRVITPLDAVHVRFDGRELINFASNDYLGLTHHPRVVEAAGRAVERYGVGSGAAPLITGYTDAHASAEAAIARWKGAESAVLLTSGYQANIALVQTLSAAGGSPDASAGGVRFLFDRLCHASLIDAVRATSDGADPQRRASFRVFPHNGIEKLRRLLSDSSRAQRRDVIVTESIFSMDGDAADLPAITDLYSPDDAERPLLLMDEAHGSGVYGPAGAGWAAETSLAHRVDATLVTLSKSLGCIGAAVCGPRLLCDAIVNLGRAYIFSTSMPASVAAAAEAAIGVLRDEPHRQQRLRALARHVRRELSAMGLSLPRSRTQLEDSPIVPILLGSPSAALAAADMLRERGLLALPIRPPTVPRGTSRLRITLSSEHSDGEIELLLQAIGGIRDAIHSK